MVIHREGLLCCQHITGPALDALPYRFHIGTVLFVIISVHILQRCGRPQQRLRLGVVQLVMLQRFKYVLLHRIFREPLSRVIFHVSDRKVSQRGPADLGVSKGLLSTLSHVLLCLRVDSIAFLAVTLSRHGNMRLLNFGPQI